MKRAALFLIPISLITATLFIQCGKKDSDQPGALEQLQKAAQQTQQVAQEMEKTMNSDQKPVPPVSFKVLLDFLPKSVENLTPGTPEGETTTLNGSSFSFARNSFESADGAMSAKVEIFDYAFIGLMYAPFQILFSGSYNRESSKGYEKSVKIGEGPGFMKWEAENRHGEATTLVGKRFIVRCETTGLPDGTAKKVLETIDLKSLATQKAS